MEYYDCEQEINRLIVGSMYIFGLFTIVTVSLSHSYSRMENLYVNKIIELEKRLFELEYSSSENESSSSEDSESSEDSDSSEDNKDDVLVTDKFEYSNTY